MERGEVVREMEWEVTRDVVDFGGRKDEILHLRLGISVATIAEGVGNT